MSDIYVSIDIEADGPIPGRNSMLQFGAAAFNPKAEDPRKPISTFEVNLDLLEGASQSADTMAWWATQGDAYANTRKDTRTPQEAMQAFLKWLRTLPGNPTLVGYPVTYDFMWIYWYTMAFGGLKDGERCPFGFQGMDIKTAAAIKLGAQAHPRWARRRHRPGRAVRQHDEGAVASRGLRSTKGRR